MMTPRKTTLWAAMLSAWLAAGQTAAPPASAEPPGPAHQADEGAVAEPPPRG
ncbi:hypothetical protein [Elioraea sp.]|uniref:hypothetical protein n=1 Tax=Elioraea sp. TaxID=2185103 RepID=UPI0021DD2A5B|nr:hypothetical protein [Elioraea sp.]GIX10159.1 MAG: hypothetical protein KatS3mg116_1869 [Elioraea sp.]